MRICLLPLALVLAWGSPVGASPEEQPSALGTARPATFGAGDGPRIAEGTYHLLDEAKSTRQSNAIAFDRVEKRARASYDVTFSLRVDEGGDGGAFLLLDTRAYGNKGPAPFVRSWVEPNLRRAFAVGIDVHNPPNREPFGPWGNYLGRPQREVALHWDGRELVKRVAPKEFRGAFAEGTIQVAFVTGGAEVSVRLAGEAVYERYFVAHMHPFPARLAIGAGTRADAATVFDVKDLAFEAGPAAERTRRPFHVGVFNHVLTDNKRTAFDAKVELPPRAWSYGRVILTLEIHDAGKDWDEWDRNGTVSVTDDEGVMRVIVPFITSYRTTCFWQVDVTHFRPWLSGTRTFEVRAGTTFYKNRGYMMSVSLDFHPGRLAQQPTTVLPVWNGVAKYKSAENHFRDFFTPRELAIPEGTTSARLLTTTTGHSQVGEFTASRRTIAFLPCVEDRRVEAQDFADRLWRDDCYLNPNRPQFGTWKYARAGWAPGDVVRPWWIDLTPHLLAGRTARLTYTPEPYTFPEGAKPPAQKEINKASHVVHSYLVLYKPGAEAPPPPTLRISNVTKDSSAQAAGLKAGDFLASYDGRTLETVEDLRKALQAAAAGDRETVPVVVYRGTKRLELEIKPGRMGIGLANP